MILGLMIARGLLWTTRKASLLPIEITPAKFSHTISRHISSNKTQMDSVDSTTTVSKNQTNGKDSPETKKQKIMPTEETILEYAKLSENAYAPTRGSKKAAGYDLYSAVDVVVPSKGKGKVATDIQIAVPEGCYGRIAPRSGLAADHFIDVGAGVVDQDYRGNVKVILFNFADKDFTVNKGDRIAQLILEKICIPTLMERDSLNVTERGDDGFGSTGVKAN